MNSFLAPLVAGFYLLSSLSYLMQLIFSRRELGRVALWLLRWGIVIHTGLLAIRLYRNGYPFIVGEGDLYLCASWVIGALFLALRARYGLQASGALFVPVSLLLVILTIARGGEYPVAGTALANPWTLVHLLSMSLTFAVFALSFLVGLTYLYEESQLKNHRSGRLLKWLPPLETMDAVHYKALMVGFALLSVGILSGAVLSKASDGKFFTGDPRQIAAIGTWVLYAAFLNVRLKSGWRGRKGIILSILGFLGVVVAFLALEHGVS